MVHIFNNVQFNHVCLYCVLITFPMAQIASPLHARQIESIESITQLDDDAFLIVDKIIDNLSRLEKKGKIKEMIDFMLDVKEEAESHLGYTICLKEQLKEVQKLAKEKGKEISKKQIDKFKEILKKREKKRNKIVFGIGFRSKKNQEIEEEYDEKECIELPVTMAFGITVTLCGLFVVFLPHPSATSAGIWIMNFGIGFIVNSGLEQAKEYQEERKRRQKSGKLIYTTQPQNWNARNGRI